MASRRFCYGSNFFLLQHRQTTLKWVDPWAVPVALSWFITISVSQMFKGRELYQLPLSRRTLWMSAWWTAMAGALLMGMIASLVPLIFDSRLPSREELILLPTFTSLYCSLAMAFAATAFGRRGDAPVDPQAVKFSGTFFLRVFVSPFFAYVVVSLAAPFLFSHYLPRRFAEINLLSAALMAGAGAIGARGYLHCPPIEARPSMRAPRAHGLAPSRSAVKDGPSFADRLTGLWLWAWLTARRELAWYAVFVGAGTVAALVLAKDSHAVLSIAGALPFASAKPFVTEPITYGALLAFTGVTGMLGTPSARSLRALPFSTNRLSVMPAAMGVLSALALWAVLLLVHVLVLGSAPVSLRIELFASVAGVLALAHMIRTVMPGSLWLRSMVATSPAMTCFVVVLPFSSWPADVVRPTMLAAGLSLVAISYAVMRWSLQRSSSVYKVQWSGVRV